jgi:cell division protein FtsB
VFLIQITVGTGMNIARTISLNSKISKIEQMQKEAKLTNQSLKEELEKYTSSKGIEALARDKLKMAGKNEVLVIIKDSPSDQTND